MLKAEQNNENLKKGDEMISEEISSTFRIGGSQIAGFWKRILAIIIDSIILGLFGLCLGLFFGDYFSRMGSWGRVIGLGIALVYFTVYNSEIGGGKTIGKTFAKIKVVSSQGELISLNKSFLRSAIYCIPYFLNGINLGEGSMESWFVYLFSILVIGCGIATVYLYIFNRRTRQTLHDLIIGTYVVAELSPISASPHKDVWRGHYLVTFIILITAGFVPVFTGSIAKSEPFLSLIPLQRTILTKADVMSAGLNVGSSWVKSSNGETKTTNYLTANVRTNNKNIDLDTMANGIAEVLLNKYLQASTMDVIVVTIVRGFDIGIASSWNTHNFSFTPKIWLQRISSERSNENFEKGK